MHHLLVSGVSDDLTQRVSASANYLGSMFSSAWKTTAKTAGDATANSSSLLTSAFTKVTAGESLVNAIRSVFLFPELEVIQEPK